MLQQRLPEALHHAAVNLSAHDQRVENATEVIDDKITVDCHFAGLWIYLQLADMRAIGMTGRIGAEATVRLETDAEFVGERAHRRIGGLGHVGDGDRLVGADDAILAVLELDVRRVCLHQRGGQLLALRNDGLARRLQRIASDDRAAGAIGAAADRDLGGVALHVADVFERDVKPLVHQLREHGGVPLAVRMRPAQDSERSAGIEA